MEKFCSECGHKLGHQEKKSKPVREYDPKKFQLCTDDPSEEEIQKLHDHTMKLVNAL